MADLGECIGSGGVPAKQQPSIEYPSPKMDTGEGQCPVCGGIVQLDGDDLIRSHRYEPDRPIRESRV